MPTPFEEAAVDAFAPHLEWWGEAVTVQPRVAGNYGAGDDPSRAAVPTRAVIIRKDGVERVTDSAMATQWDRQAANYPLVAYLPVAPFPSWLPRDGDRIVRADPPAGEPAVLEVSRLGNRRGSRIVLYCIEGPPR